MEKVPSKKENGDQQEKAPERIISAAVLFRGKMFKGNTHVDALDVLTGEHPHWEDDVTETPEQGFFTSTGRFVERDEAGSIAAKAHQLEPLYTTKKRGTIYNVTLTGTNQDPFVVNTFYSTFHS